MFTPYSYYYTFGARPLGKLPLKHMHTLLLYFVLSLVWRLPRWPGGKVYASSVSLGVFIRIYSHPYVRYVCSVAITLATTTYSSMSLEAPAGADTI